MHGTSTARADRVGRPVEIAPMHVPRKRADRAGGCWSRALLGLGGGWQLVRIRSTRRPWRQPSRRDLRAQPARGDGAATSADDVVVTLPATTSPSPRRTSSPAPAATSTSARSTSAIASRRASCWPDHGAPSSTIQIAQAEATLAQQLEATCSRRRPTRELAQVTTARQPLVKEGWVTHSKATPIA